MAFAQLQSNCSELVWGLAPFLAKRCAAVALLVACNSSTSAGDATDVMPALGDRTSIQAADFERPAESVLAHTFLAVEQPLPQITDSGIAPASFELSEIRIEGASPLDQPPDVRTDQRFASSATDDALQGAFDEGFKFTTADDEFDLVVHSELQLDTRAYGEADPDPVNQFGFYVPRARLIFNGHLTRPIEYAVSINKGLGSLDLLDAYLNFNYDERCQFRIGRFRAPFTYDWYAQSNQFLLTPERSVFAVNYGYNRNFATMLHGALCEGRVEYAVAAANGPRNQYYDFNAGKDFLGYLNVRPFDGVEPLRNLNFGYSVAFGTQDQEPLPRSFRTSANATESEGTVEAAPAFLVLRDGVRERGAREMHELFVAWYFRQLTLQAAWDDGYNDYQAPLGDRVRLPTHGYHAQFGYFLTGEELERRTFVDPLRPFDLREGKRGPGAIEVQARYDDFEVGNAVFTQNLANDALYTNHVRTVDSGINWYLNKYIKVYFDWQHSMYSNPVAYRPGARHRTSDLYWTRFQLYF